MRNLITLFLISSSLLFGTAYTATQSGFWDVAATWGGAGVPGNTDTCTVTGFTVTVRDARTVGTSGSTGTVACDLGASGILAIASTGSLVARGDITASGAGGPPGPTQFTVAGGGIFEWDASLATTPLSQHYKFNATTNFNYLSIAFNGSSGSHAIIRSNASGGSGYFNSSVGDRMAVTATYTDFLRLADASNNAFNLVQIQDPSATWSVSNSTFTSCGSITNASCSGGCALAVNQVFIHDYNIHTGTTGAGIFAGWGTATNIGTGTREMKGNVFDVPLNNGTFYPVDFTITGNYFGQGFFFTVGDWATFSNNFYRTALTAQPVLMNARGGINNSYIYNDADVDNPHFINLDSTPTSTQTFDGLIFGMGKLTANEGSIMLGNSTSATATGPYVMQNSIVLPTTAGYGIGWSLIMTADQNNIQTFRLFHNTAWMGFVAGQRNYGMSSLGHNNFVVAAGTLAAMKSNLMVNPGLANYTPNAWSKVRDLALGTATNTDVCNAAGCDYNATWNMPVCSTAFAGQGNGYCGTFTVTPGAHDLADQTPRFYDYQRNMELYDSKALGNHPAAWSNVGTYALGAFVSSADATVPSTTYWGLTVNYRCIAVAGCTGAPQPGKVSHATWDPYWEWATLYRMRQDIAANGTASTFINTMMQWIRAGYTPMNTALWRAGHDGQDIGAVQHSETGVSPNSGVSVKGSVK